jgi:hypothetical protein
MPRRPPPSCAAAAWATRSSWFSDGAPGVIKAIETCFPRPARQRRLAHRMRNLATKVPEDQWPEVKARIQACQPAGSAQTAEPRGRPHKERTAPDATRVSRHVRQPAPHRGAAPCRYRRRRARGRGPSSAAGLQLHRPALVRDEARPSPEVVCCLVSMCHQGTASLRATATAAIWCPAPRPDADEEGRQRPRRLGRGPGSLHQHRRAWLRPNIPGPAHHGRASAPPSHTGGPSR